MSRKYPDICPCCLEYDVGGGDSTCKPCTEYVEQAKAEQREADAKLIEAQAGDAGTNLGDVIRAQGKVKPANDPPTHRCKVCGALWWLGDVPPVGMSWSLRSPSCGKCCDNVEMGDQIEPLADEVKPTEQRSLELALKSLRHILSCVGVWEATGVSRAHAITREVNAVIAALSDKGD